MSYLYILVPLFVHAVFTRRLTFIGGAAKNENICYSRIIFAAGRAAEARGRNGPKPPSAEARNHVW